MSTPQENIDATLDELLNNEDEPIVDEPIVDELPGYMSYEQWIEAGKDPDDFKGKNAYSHEYDRIQENKDQKKELKRLSTMVSQVAEYTESEKKSAAAQARKDLLAEIEQAKDDEDVEAALDAKQRLEEHDSNVPIPKNETLLSLIAETPLTDTEHDDYNKEFATDHGALYNSLIERLSNNGALALSDSQIKKAWNVAFNDAKKLNPDIFKSPKRGRQQAPGKTTTETQGKGKTNLSDISIGSRNPHDVNSAQSVADALKEKFGDKFDADLFAEKLTGED